VVPFVQIKPRSSCNIDPSKLDGESTIECWETSKTRIPDERKLELAKLLDVTPSELMGWD
jgi:hypothetical protein